MPIVFIHGVNNRAEDENYMQGVNSKREFFLSIFAPQMKMSVVPQNVIFPYWGGSGVKFRWKQASLPQTSDDIVALGTNDANLNLWLGEVRFQQGSNTVNLGEVSRKDGFVAAIDLFWDTASVATPSNRVHEIAKCYEASLKYAETNPAPTWAMSTPPLDNVAFAQKLLAEIAPYQQNNAVPPVAVALGLGDWLASAREAIRRLGNAPGDAVSAALTRLGRKSVHESASRFLGDIFIYLTTRDQTGPSSILADVLKKLKEADCARTTGDDKLVVVGHSLGGLLAYDALTHYLPDIKVDYFITIGSQVALFEEMTLCRTSQLGVPENPPNDRLPKPSNVGRWVNVYDTNDVFSFRAEGVFLDVEDYKFDTGYGLLGAHGGYFLSPSFYRRLAKRITGSKA
ncbi:esterase/lipase family protein [Aeromonas sp. 604534]|uniref:esterase/lipase family protein n=1 Tax=Aeromonas sp. 604534 TaxID=2712055 RepID=UPI003B9F610C